MKNIPTYKLCIVFLAALSMFQFLPSKSMADINGPPNCMTKDKYLSHNFASSPQIQECITQYQLRILHAQNAKSGRFKSQAHQNEEMPLLTRVFIDFETLFNLRNTNQKSKVLQLEIAVAQDQIELELAGKFDQDPVRKLFYLLAKHSVLRKKNEFDGLLRTSKMRSAELFKSLNFGLITHKKIRCFAMLDIKEIQVSELFNSVLFKSCVNSRSAKRIRT